MAKASGAPTAKAASFTDAKDTQLHVFGLGECDIQLDEGTADAPKREITLTAIREGAGNARDRRWYERSCIEGLEPLVYSRKKIFYNHLREGLAPGSDDLRDWPATIMKTWLTEGANGVERKVRLKVHDDWLWER